jgi:hypothetical protein
MLELSVSSELDTRHGYVTQYGLAHRSEGERETSVSNVTDTR